MVTAIRAVGTVEVNIDGDGYLVITQTDPLGEEHVICIPAEMAKQLVEAISTCMQSEGP